MPFIFLAIFAKKNAPFIRQSRLCPLVVSSGAIPGRVSFLSSCAIAAELSKDTAFSSVMKSDRLIHLQALEVGRVLSMVINENTGHMTAAVLRDGLSVSIFGVCTDADI